MKSVIVHSEATEELDNAIKYYEKQKRGLGLDLLSEIKQALEKIKINPNLGYPIRSKGYVTISFVVFLLLSFI